MSNRIEGHGTAPATASAGITFDGAPVAGWAGETIAAALAGAGIRSFRHTKGGSVSASRSPECRHAPMSCPTNS
jgi:hypothetical protein